MLEHWINLCSIAWRCCLCWPHVLRGLAQVDVDQSLTIEQYVNDVLLGRRGQRHQHQFHRLHRANWLHDGRRRRAFPSTAAHVEFGQCRGRLLCGSRMFELRRGQSHRQRLVGHCQQRARFDWSGVFGDSVNDLCVLEFDFDPAGDYVSFNYVFGSVNTRPGKTLSTTTFSPSSCLGPASMGLTTHLGRSRVRPSTSQAFLIQILNCPSPSALSTAL